VRSSSTCASSSRCTAAKARISEILTTDLAAPYEALDIAQGVDLARPQEGIQLARPQEGIQLALLLVAHQHFSYLGVGCRETAARKHTPCLRKHMA
jgi:hypothetical protein